MTQTRRGADKRTCGDPPALPDDTGITVVIVEPMFFATAADFRAWLEANHATAGEILVGFHKVGTGRPSMTWPESVDQALCFGWIDGVRRSLGSDSYVIRFTPRKAASTWSRVNVTKAKALIRLGQMTPAGLAAFECRSDERTGVYSFESGPKALAPDQEAEFKRNRQAWSWFQGQAPSYRRTAIHWVLSAKRAETRRSRLETLIGDSAAGRKIKPLRRPGE